MSPGKLVNGQTVPCRKCWLCRQTRVDDWVGRCIAESETATATRSITLTYGRDRRNGAVNHERAAVLTYSDVQGYFKRLRANGYPCRYFAVGEYGSLKGRSHWHCIVFFQDTVPEHVLADREETDETAKAGFRFMERHWPEGWSYWEEPSPASIRYVCKYLMKDQGKEERQGHLAMSKKPPLGDRYFRELAGRYVAQGLAPQDPYYSFPHVRDRDGMPTRFYMAGVTLDNFCRSFLDQWRAVYGERHPPHSELLEAYEDRVAKLPDELRLEPFRPRVPAPWIAPPNGAQVRFCEKRNIHYYLDEEGRRLYWSFNLEGKRAWQSVIRTEDAADRLRIDAGRHSSPDRYVAAKYGATR